MNRFKKFAGATLVAGLSTVGAFAVEPTAIVTITEGVAEIHPEFITNKLLTMQGLVIGAVVGMLILGIAYKLIVRKSNGACK